MASVTLTRCWINLASDPSQAVQVKRRTGGTTTGITGDVRQYGPGRSRPVLKGGLRGQTTVQVRTTDRALIATLQSWVGQTVCVRDERGRKAFGVFFEVPEADQQARRTDVDLTIVHTSYSEAV